MVITLTSLSTEYITVPELSEGIGVSYGTAKAILESTGTGEPIGNMMVYSRLAAEQAIAKKYGKVLEFLGCSASENWGVDT